MSNTVITNYTDLNGPSTKADSSVVVIVNKDGSLSVDENLLGTLMGTDGSSAAGISVVRVGHEGRPDDATDSESDDDKVPHVTLSVDSYYGEPNSIIKYDSGAEMLQSLRIETRENSLLGFQNDHCYTPLTSPNESSTQRSDSYAVYDEPIIEIKHPQSPKNIPSSKKITILEQKILPKGKKIVINPSDAVLLKGNDFLNKPLPAKSKKVTDVEKTLEGNEDSTESSSISSSGESIPDRDSDSDYKEDRRNDKSGSSRKTKAKPRILKTTQAKVKLEPKAASRLRGNKNILKREIKEKLVNKSSSSLESQLRDYDSPKSKDSLEAALNDAKKEIAKQTPKTVKKEKKTPAHMTALLSDMTSLFSTPDVIRRVSTDNKTPTAKESSSGIKKTEIVDETNKILEPARGKNVGQKTYSKPKAVTPIADKSTKGYDLIPQIDDASLAQILQDTTGISGSAKNQPTITTTNAMSSPGLAGPLSPTLDLLASLQPEEEGLTEDLLMHVAQLVESSENLQEVIDKQVLGKVDTGPLKATINSPFQQHQPHASSILYNQMPTKSPAKITSPKEEPKQIIRRDGRVITLPPIEAPATRASKRKSQMETASSSDVLPTPPPQPSQLSLSTPEPPHPQPLMSKQYINKKLVPKKPDQVAPPLAVDKASAESQESWNSEDDPNRIWCICRQPHNNRFMICCDGCEDWFHGKCVNITKVMGQQMEEQGIEWRCPNCVKKTKPKISPKALIPQRKRESDEGINVTPRRQSGDGRGFGSKTSCIVCKKPARPSSIYCSDACILKHAQDSLGTQGSPSKMDEPGKEKQKSESRVIVFERKTGRCLAGPNAPTAENLKAWLQKNPTFEVVRPGTLSAIKPKQPIKRPSTEPTKVQTTLNFARIPKKVPAQQSMLAKGPQQDPREGPSKVTTPMREETRPVQQPKTPVTPKTIAPRHFYDTPQPSTSTARPSPSDPRPKPVRPPPNRPQPNLEKPSVSPAASRRKESLTPDNKSRMNSDESIRDNVRKALQEQMGIRMKENMGPKFTEKEIKQYAIETETELHELFRDVGVKYKAKYRSLMFNIKDRKNLSLWQKICDKSITPKQLVRLSPEELASQELAQWRDKEAKYQLELIKKSELDLLAASKTYVLKTHKGEEVMENKESVSAELDQSVPVEDVVQALNETTGDEPVVPESPQETGTAIRKMSADSGEKYSSSKKRDKEESDGHSKKSRESKRDSDNRRSSRSSRKRSGSKEKKEERLRRSERKSSRLRSPSKERLKVWETDKEKADPRERSRHRSRSRGKSKKRSKSRDKRSKSRDKRSKSRDKRSKSRDKLSKSRDRSRSKSQGRDRSHSRSRDKLRSHSRDARRRNRSRSKHRPSTEDKVVHRSRSQESTYSKSKNDSTDSDSVERPKSAMLKEIHPEYDPHEPMITSALSDEDLKKSREDVFEDTFKADVVEFVGADFDASKSFSIESDIILPKFSGKRDKISVEVESDQEPSSTVDNSAATVWNGCINMVDVARFYVSAHEVSGVGNDLEEDLSAELDIVGRINPDTVWDYISKMKRTGNKDIVILRLQAANDEEKMQYIALYSYLSSRKRLGVVKVTNTTTVKDFYIVPLPANVPLPSVLLPLDGPGLEEVKNHLLIGIVIRQRKKRAAPNIPKDIIPAKVARESRKRSYTPPALPSSSLGLASGLPSGLALPGLSQPPYTSLALSTSVKDKIAASLAAADDGDEAYSPGSSSNESVPRPPVAAASAPPSDVLRTKMEELNRQIEEQKQQIMKMACADSSVSGGDEAYSPSRPMTPSPPAAPTSVLADIALPSNLQEILATIKQRTETANSTDVDMRTMPPS